MLSTYRHKAPLTMAQRADATRRTIDVWRPRPFDWAAKSHCIALAHAQGRAMGHRLPVLPVIRSALAAKRALNKLGFETVEDMLSAYFPRIVPAAMRVGDLCAGPPSADGLGLAAIGVADGQGNIFGWHDHRSTELATIQFSLGQLTMAWRLGA